MPIQNPRGPGIQRSQDDVRYRDAQGRFGQGQTRGGDTNRRYFNKNGNNSRNNGRRRNTRSLPPVHVFTRDFNRMHRETQAARYKVHKPNCTCKKVVSLGKDRHIQMKEGLKTDERGDNTASGEEILDSTGPLLSIHEDSEDGNGTSLSHSIFNGLLVVPDVKGNVRSVYLCVNTPSKVLLDNQQIVEGKLRHEIFPDNDNDDDDDNVRNEDLSSFKVSCAACMLEMEPNGFACVSSKSRDRVDGMRRIAEEAAIRKQESTRNGLHSDHADACLTLPRHLLWIRVMARTRNRIQEAEDALLQHFQEQGIDVSSKETRTIKLQHHLESLLTITQTYPDEKKNDIWWLVMVFDDTSSASNPCWSLDLPGGKRHLGERAIQGAIRETEEEISLVWSPSWIRRNVKDRKKGGTGNVYFLLTPPPPSTNDL